MVLDEIIDNKKEELERRKRELPLELLKAHIDSVESTRQLSVALSQPGMSLIAEIKKASPSAGIIKEDFNLEEIARSYEENGASAISVLTESKYFQGSLDHLRRVKKVVSLPLLRKDFILDEYQIYESRACGADAILLIIAVIKDDLHKLLKITNELGMEALVEIHDKTELGKALDAGAEIIGINNRNLATLEVNQNVCYTLAPLVPKGKIVVAESGIHSREDVVKLEKLNVDAILVGEALMKSSDIGVKIKELMGVKV